MLCRRDIHDSPVQNLNEGSINDRYQLKMTAAKRASRDTDRATSKATGLSRSRYTTDRDVAAPNGNKARGRRAKESPIPSDTTAARGRHSQMPDGKVRERSSAVKYEAILRAAIKVFARSGFFNSKVADVAKEAGVADGTVYLYFKNKDDILVSIFSSVVDEALEKGRARLRDLDDPIGIIRQIATAHLELFSGNRDLAVVFQAELRSSTKFMEQFSAAGVTEYLELIRTAIQEGQKRGLIRNELNSTLMAKILFGALDEMVTNWVLSKKRYSLVATGEAVLDVFFNGIAVR